MTTDIEAMLRAAKDTITVGRVFGEPIERGAVTIIPVAAVLGGGGGGESTDDADDVETGSGGGFGLWARPVGVYVVRGDEVTFRPAVDVVPLVAVTLVLLGAGRVVRRIGSGFRGVRRRSSRR